MTRTNRNILRDSIVVFASLLVGCVIPLDVALADETCNSPYVTKLIKGQEDYVYVWALGVEGVGDGSDKLVTVDVHPKSKRYGKVIASVSVGTRGEGYLLPIGVERGRVAGDGSQHVEADDVPRSLPDTVERALPEQPRE